MGTADRVAQVCLQAARLAHRPQRRLHYRRRFDLQEAPVMALSCSESRFPDNAATRCQPGKRVVPKCEAANDLVFSAYVNSDAEVFPQST